MEKKLPGVFANKIDKEFNNNEKVFYSKEKDDENKQEKTKLKESKNIYQKINEIFSSEKYVYKADVEIKTRNGIIRTKVIGQNKTHLITLDNELIPIVDIEDINYIK